MHYYLIASTGADGDVFPLLTLGEHLKKRGHSVTFASAEPYREASLKSGLKFVALSTGDEHEAALRDKFLLNSRYELLFALRHALQCNCRVAHSITSLRSPALVVLAVDRPFLWADLAQCSAYDIPLVRVQIDLPPLEGLNTAISKLPAMRVQGFLSARLESEWRSIMRGEGQSFGLNHIRRLWQSVRRSVPTIALWPPWAIGQMSDGLNEAAFGFVPSLRNNTEPPYELKNGWSSERPFVIFVAGTAGTVQSWSREFFEVSAAICRHAGYQGLLLGGNRFMTAGPDEPVDWQRFVRLQQVLPQARAIVHHGGIGTAGAALEHGVPQVIVPRVFGQVSNAEWMRRLGVCSVLSPKMYTIGHGSESLRTVLGDPVFRDRSQRCSMKFQTERTVDRLCSYLESSYVRRGGTGERGNGVAVGTAIADRPPHRSVRAALPHTAPTSDVWRQIARRDKGASAGGVEGIRRRAG